MPGGRPPLYSSPEELEKMVDDYFEKTEKVTLAGLAVHLGMGRRTLYEYDKKDKYLHIIKKARERVEAWYEELALFGERPTGVIFALKNMGWKDRIDTTSGDKPIEPTKVDLSGLDADTLRKLKEQAK